MMSPIYLQWERERERSVRGTKKKKKRLPQNPKGTLNLQGSTPGFDITVCLYAVTSPFQTSLSSWGVRKEGTRSERRINRKTMWQVRWKWRRGVRRRWKTRKTHRAAAPEMISISSLVMTACRVWLKVSVSWSIISAEGEEEKLKSHLLVSELHAIARSHGSGAYRRSCWRSPWLSS